MNLDTIKSLSLSDLKEVEKAIKSRKGELVEQIANEKEARLAHAQELAGRVREGSIVSFLHKGETLTSKVERVSKKTFTIELKTESGKPMRKGFDCLVEVE